MGVCQKRKPEPPELSDRQGPPETARMRGLVAGEDVVCELERRRCYDREVAVRALASTGQDAGEIVVAEGLSNAGGKACV